MRKKNNIISLRDFFSHWKCTFGNKMENIFISSLLWGMAKIEILPLMFNINIYVNWARFKRKLKFHKKIFLFRFPHASHNNCKCDKHLSTIQFSSILRCKTRLGSFFVFVSNSRKMWHHSKYQKKICCEKRVRHYINKRRWCVKTKAKRTRAANRIEAGKMAGKEKGMAKTFRG